jgi:hypothetical protein
MRPTLTASGRTAARAAQATVQPSTPLARRSQATGGGASREQRAFGATRPRAKM